MTDLLLFAIIALWLVKQFYIRWDHFQSFSKINLSGPKPSFLFGNLLEYEGRKSGKCAVEVLDDWYSEFGEVYGFYSGVRPTVVIHDLDLIKEILVTRSYQEFSSRLTPVVHTKPLLDTLVGRKGQGWKHLRSRLSPMFSPSKIRHMSQHMNESVATTVKILSRKAGKTVDALALFQALSCEVIGKCCLGMNGASCQTNPHDTLLTAMKDFLSNVVNKYILLARCFPWCATMIQLYLNVFYVSGQMTRIVCDHVAQAIHHRRKEQRDAKRCVPETVDILQFLLESVDKKDGAKARAGRRLTDDEIIANSWMFLLGGFETTSVALTFIFHLLAHHPQIQDKLLLHVRAVCDGRADASTGLSYEDVATMDYLDQVVSEALRMYPPVVTFVIREAETEMKIGKWVVPAGTTLMVPVWQIHHDPKVWTDPHTFDPDRFNHSRVDKHHPMSFVPFGAGPRSCIGMRFALLEIKLAVAHVLLKFRVQPTRNAKTVRITVPTVNISPKDNVYLKFVPRD